MQNDTLVSNQSDVCTLLNDFYINIAKNIGIDSHTQMNEEHPSVIQIKHHKHTDTTFNFTQTTPDIIQKYLYSLNPQKQLEMTISDLKS